MIAWRLLCKCLGSDIQSTIQLNGLTSPWPVESTDMLLNHRLLKREFAKSVPITLGEFQTSLSKSKPPTGWGNRLGAQKLTNHFLEKILTTDF